VVVLIKNHERFKRLFVALFEKLAATDPTVLACMHGSAWCGDGAKLLRAIAGALSA